MIGGKDDQVERDISRSVADGGVSERYLTTGRVKSSNRVPREGEAIMDRRVEETIGRLKRVKGKR